MKKVLLIALAAALLLAGPSPSGGAETGVVKPKIRIAQVSPLVVAGERFRASERVVVRVVAGDGKYMRILRASRRGTFVVRFAAVTADRCGGLFVSATTRDGRSAKASMPQPLCPPGSP